MLRPYGQASCWASEIWKSPSKSSPAVAGKRVFVGIGSDLVALDRDSGREQWRAQTGGNVDSSPLVVADSVYIGSGDRSFYAFNADSGTKTWSFETGGSVTGSPTSGDGLILIGVQPRTRTRSRRWTRLTRSICCSTLTG